VNSWICCKPILQQAETTKVSWWNCQRRKLTTAILTPSFFSCWKYCCSSTRALIQFTTNCFQSDLGVPPPLLLYKGTCHFPHVKPNMIFMHTARFYECEKCSHKCKSQHIVITSVCCCIIYSCYNNIIFTEPKKKSCSTWELTK
jgi:hypothetical protein